MTRCLYCNKEKSSGECSLEHLIPQFLGGAYAPEIFKTRAVCRRCNNILGLFVDAAFEKDWTVSNHLAALAREALVLRKGPTSEGVPLICMGLSELAPPEMRDGEVCETWLGPHGEQVYLIRESDERLYWYTGGNPISAKQREARAYFQFSEKSHMDVGLTWWSFRDAFEGKRVRKIMVTQVAGADPASIGFVEPDDLDRVCAAYFANECSASNVRKNTIPLNVRFDWRFLGKLALGVSFALFGQQFLETSYCAELRKLLWLKVGPDDSETPKVLGATAYQYRFDVGFREMTGLPDAVILMLSKVGDGLGLTLNIGAKQAWAVMCARQSEVDAEKFRELDGGLVFILSKTRRTSLQLTLPEFLNTFRQTPEKRTFEGLLTAKRRSCKG